MKSEVPTDRRRVFSLPAGAGAAAGAAGRMAASSELSTKLLKLLLLGNSTVGKTSLMLRFCDRTFSPNFSPTIGVGAPLLPPRRAATHACFHTVADLLARAARLQV